MQITQKEIDNIFKSIKNDVFKLIDTWVNDTLENIINSKPVNQRGLWDRFKVGFTNMVRGRQNEKNPYYLLNKFGDQLGVQESLRMDLDAYLAFKECIEKTELQINEALTPDMEKLALVKTIRNAANTLKNKLDLTFQSISAKVAKRAGVASNPPPGSSSSSSVPLPGSSSSSVVTPPPPPSSSSSSSVPLPGSSSSSVVTPPPPPSSSSSSSKAPPPPSSSSSSSKAPPPPSSSSSSSKKSRKKATVSTDPSSSGVPLPAGATKTRTIDPADVSLSTNDNLLLGRIYVDDVFIKSNSKEVREAILKNEFPKDSILKLEKVLDNLENKLVRPLYEKIEKEKGEDSKEAKDLATWFAKFVSAYKSSEKEEDLLEDLVAKIRTGDVLEKITKVIGDPKITKSTLLDIIKSN